MEPINPAQWDQLFKELEDLTEQLAAVEVRSFVHTVSYVVELVFLALILIKVW